jgi:hypothetical protein
MVLKVCIAHYNKKCLLQITFLRMLENPMLSKVSDF